MRRSDGRVPGVLAHILYVISNTVGVVSALSGSCSGKRSNCRIPIPDTEGCDSTKWLEHTANIPSRAAARHKGVKEVGTGDQGASDNRIRVQDGGPLGR